MSTEDAPREVGSNDGLGPLLAEADMDALKAVAHNAGLGGIDLRALARVLDAAQRVAVAAERERYAKVCEAVAGDLEKAEEDGQAMSIGAQSCADQIRAGA